MGRGGEFGRKKHEEGKEGTSRLVQEQPEQQLWVRMQTTVATGTI